MQFFTSINDIRKRTELLAYVRVLERAWEEFGLSGVLCVDNIPVLYQKDVRHPLPPTELNYLHRRFWNQGIAKVLVVVDPKTVRIFSGLAKPQKDDSPLNDSPALIETLDYIKYVQREQSFHQSIVTGDYYRKPGHTVKFQPNGCVDRYLVENLVAFRDKLVKTEHALSTEVAHSLICRLLFVCYLVDRGIVHLPGKVGVKLSDAISFSKDATAYLYDIFASLKDQFNGSMFDQDLEQERALIHPEHIELLKLFLGGHLVAAGQWTLGFWAYDFKLIPVETISSIYEEFLIAQNSKDKHDNGVFYTPRFLAEMTLDVALEGRKDWATLRYLDPCCGSGIFLVTLFNRLATRWLLDHPRADYRCKADAMLAILTLQIRGMDKNSTACRLACFSLYISLLEALSPSDIKTYIATKNKLPLLLNDIMARSKMSGKNFIPVVICDDFLRTRELSEHGFDIAIGNPPWIERGSKQSAQHILEHLDNYLSDNGDGCLLLPSKLFLNNQTNTFQARWLRKHILRRVVQLADFSFILFEHALCPCMVIRYSRSIPSESKESFVTYDTPKFNMDICQRGRVTITASDRKFIPYWQLVQAADNDSASRLWKRRLWGTLRDQRLLDYLDSLPKLEKLSGEPDEKKRWIKGQGFQPDASGKSKKKISPWWNECDLYIPARTNILDSGLFLFRIDCELIGNRYQSLRRAPRGIYQAPMVLVSKGFGKIVFSNFNVLFQDVFLSISGPAKDEDLLLFLTALLRSNLAKFVMFHTAASWGTERVQVQQKELLRLAFPLPEESPAKDAVEIIKDVAAQMRQEKATQEKLYWENRPLQVDMFEDDKDSVTATWLCERKKRSLALQAKLDRFIYKYFSLLKPEIAVIEDTINISIPSSTPSAAIASRFELPTLQPVMNPKGVPGYERGLAVYAETLVDTLNVWASERKSDFRVSASGGADSESGLALVTLKLGKKDLPFSERSFSGKLAEQFAKGYAACARETNTLRHERELLWFESDKIHILRPAVLMHWTRTAALNDADHIYGEIALARRQSHA